MAAPRGRLIDDGQRRPIFRDGIGDTDLLLTRTIDPISAPAAALQRVAGGRPEGADASIGIR